VAPAKADQGEQATEERGEYPMSAGTLTRIRRLCYVLGPLPAHTAGGYGRRSDGVSNVAAR
jgi:hypothetical protein